MKLNLDKYNLAKDDAIIVGVSGGPDSMFLLASLLESGYKPIVCHVNYHKRESALRDELIVQEYCKNNSILFFKKDCKSYVGNFQEYAREFRYNFFLEVYEKYSAKALLIAHHLDDALETYIYRKNRHSKATSLSILDEEYIFNMHVVRPLLKLLKEDIIDSCNNTNIPYGIDESNLESHYERNKIRNDYISSLTKEEKLALINEMNKAEENWQNTRQNCLKIINNNSFNIKDFINLNDEEKNIVLCELIKNSCAVKSKNISSGYLQEIINVISKDRSHCFIELDEGIYLEKDRDTISINETSIKDYEYIIKSFDDKSCPYIKDNGVKMEGIFVKEEDFPLTVRNYKENDQIELKNGHKHVNRLFIDKKIPLLERKTYPILLNKDGIILLIPGLYRLQSRKDLNNNLFMLK